MPAWTPEHRNFDRNRDDDDIRTNLTRNEDDFPTEIPAEIEDDVGQQGKN